MRNPTFFELVIQVCRTMTLIFLVGVSIMVPVYLLFRLFQFLFL